MSKHSPLSDMDIEPFGINLFPHQVMNGVETPIIPKADGRVCLLLTCASHGEHVLTRMNLTGVCMKRATVCDFDVNESPGRAN